MCDEKSFDWKEYVKLANSYMNENNPAKQRTGISRFYYGSFCSSRDLIIVYYLMFLPFCNIILGLLFSCENKFFYQAIPR